MKFQEELTAYIRAGYPLLYVSALEPERAIASIEKVCDSINGGLSCHLWKVTTGWDGSGSGDDPDEIFQYINYSQDKQLHRTKYGQKTLTNRFQQQT